MYKRIKIIAGHYGSGKTEFSLNYAIDLAAKGKRVVLADLDLVNPFFRSREKAGMLEQKGIRVIASSLGNRLNADLPALDSQLYSVFEDESYECVVDLGGDHTGAKVLGRFKKFINEDNHELWMIVNANRPETITVEKALCMFRSIESTTQLKVTGLINNTHLVRETREEDILRGNRLCQKLSGITGVPFMYNCVNKYVENKLDGKIEGAVFPLEIRLRPNWI